jgi:murein DD-endopeptidase MepM/ murein hydrolase activator NlpD
MQPVRLKSRPVASTRPPDSSSGTGLRPPTRPRRARGGRLTSVLVIVLMIAGLGWGAVATYLLIEEKATVATLRQEQASVQSYYKERERVWNRQRVAAILSQGSAGPQVPGSEGAQDHLADLISRQVDLETRQNLLGVITGQAVTPILPAPGAQVPATGANKLAANDLIPANILDRVNPAAAAPVRRQVAAGLRAAEAMPLTERIDILAQSLDRVDGAQNQQISALGAGLAARVREVKAGLTELGLDVAKVKLPPARAAMGGPFVPLSAGLRVGSFEHRLAQLNDAQMVFGRWRDLATIVPLQRPLDGDDSTTSNFGSRTDPFTGTSAMHAGMDFRATVGTPIKAAGAGKVLRAEVAGGYGNLVEIDHGNGLTTRYGHLSAFDVKAGDIVAAGTVIGRAGSTGRSTGPHLHYETRRDEEALNPLKFILVGARLARDPTARP